MATYLFSGFTEVDLVTTPSIDMGQSFNVPGASTHNFQVEDDNARMSGDTDFEGTSDDRSPTISIQRGNSSAGSGHIYLDEIYTLKDAAGNRYTMYELEMEDTSEDFYVLQDPPPASGTRLTVVGIEDATAGQVSYDEFVGNDSYRGGSGDGANHSANVYGGAGNDHVSGTRSSDTLFGGIGRDTLIGSEGADRVYGGGNDALYGDAGEDQLYGGTGNDQFYGGNQDDQILAAA